MKVLDSIASILMAVAGGLICGLYYTEFNFLPLGIVFIILGFIFLIWNIIDVIIENVVSGRNRETNVIINIPKREKPAEKAEDIDMAENWEDASDCLIKLVDEELFDKEKQQ